MMKNPNTPSAGRDMFIRKQTAAVGGFVILPRYVLGGKGYTATVTKVHIGMSGGGVQDRVMFD